MTFFNLSAVGPIASGNQAHNPPPPGAPDILFVITQLAIPIRGAQGGRVFATAQKRNDGTISGATGVTFSIRVFKGSPYSPTIDHTYSFTAASDIRSAIADGIVAAWLPTGDNTGPHPVSLSRVGDSVVVDLPVGESDWTVYGGVVGDFSMTTAISQLGYPEQTVAVPQIVEAYIIGTVLPAVGYTISLAATGNSLPNLDHTYITSESDTTNADVAAGLWSKMNALSNFTVDDITVGSTPGKLRITSNTAGVPYYDFSRLIQPYDIPASTVSSHVLLGSIAGMYYADGYYKSPDLIHWLAYTGSSVPGLGQLPSSFLWSSPKNVFRDTLVDVPGGSVSTLSLAQFTGAPSGRDPWQIGGSFLQYGGYTWVYVAATPSSPFDYQPGSYYRTTDYVNYDFVALTPTAFGWNDGFTVLTYAAIPSITEKQGYAQFAGKVFAFSYDEFASQVHIFSTSDFVTWSSVASATNTGGSGSSEHLDNVIEWKMVDYGDGHADIFIVLDQGISSTSFYKITSTDGITWSSPITCTLPDVHRTVLTDDGTGSVSWDDKMSIASINWDGTRLVSFSGRFSEQGVTFNYYTSTDGGSTWVKGPDDRDMDTYHTQFLGHFEGKYVLSKRISGGANIQVYYDIP